MKIFDNISEIVRDDMTTTIAKGSKVSVAAACFSMYAYKELKKQLEGVGEFRFIFTSPTFTTEKASKEKREFYIPRLNRESSLYGTEFEIKLRNEMTQKSIAKECADWIRRKAVFKSNITGENMQGFMTVESSTEQVAYMPMTGFTTVDIGCERGNNSYNMTNRMEAPFSTQYMQLFEKIWNDRSKMQDVTDVVIENISSAYNENSPEFIYFMTLYHVFSEFLADISEDVLPNESTGFKESKIWNLLYDFQKDAVLAIINKLEKYNGCILADSVGLGKTFTALAVVKYYENRNKSVLVLCPKKLAENWNTYKGNYMNNPIALDRLRYDVLFHTDLSRTGGTSNGIELDRLNWGNYDLVVIDESHNFRNGVGTHANTTENRYVKLMEKVIRTGVKTKVLMLSATPVNNRFVDLRNQLAIAYEGDSEQIDSKLATKKSIDDIFRQAQKAYNAWCKLDPEDRTTDIALLGEFYESYSDDYIKRYKEEDNIGRFFWDTFKRKAGKQYYPITCPDGTVLEYDEDGNAISWLRSKARFDSDIAAGEIRIIKIGEKWSVQFKQRIPLGKTPRSIFTTETVIDDRGTTSTGASDVYDYFKKDVFSNPKPVELIRFLLGFGLGENDIVLDFFSGSGTTAEAVMRSNLEGGKNKFILVQLPENIDPLVNSSSANAKRVAENAVSVLDEMEHPHLLTELAKERIRRAGEKIKSESPLTTADLDVGFRVLKLDDTNMKDVYYAPDDYDQGLLAGLESNIKDDRTDLDLLFGCLLDWGLPLSMPYSSEQIDGCTVHTYNDGDLIACFDENVPESVVEKIAKRQPLRVVFRDSGFANSPAKINVTEIFKLLAPDTRVKVI